MQIQSMTRSSRRKLHSKKRQRLSFFGGKGEGVPARNCRWEERVLKRSGLLWDDIGVKRADGIEGCRIELEKWKREVEEVVVEFEEENEFYFSME